MNHGAEYTLKDRLGMIDLLYQDYITDDPVVIELKVVPALKNYEQIMNYIRFRYRINRFYHDFVGTT